MSHAEQVCNGNLSEGNGRSLAKGVVERMNVAGCHAIAREYEVPHYLAAARVAPGPAYLVPLRHYPPVAHGPVSERGRVEDLPVDLTKVDVIEG